MQFLTWNSHDLAPLREFANYGTKSWSKYASDLTAADAEFSGLHSQIWIVMPENVAKGTSSPGRIAPAFCSGAVRLRRDRRIHGPVFPRVSPDRWKPQRWHRIALPESGAPGSS